MKRKNGIQIFSGFIQFGKSQNIVFLSIRQCNFVYKNIRSLSHLYVF